MYMRGSTRKVQNGVSKQTRFSNNRLLTGMASQAADSVTKQHYHSPGLKLANSGILPKENKRPVTALVTQELLADMKVVGDTQESILPRSHYVICPCSTNVVSATAKFLP